MLFVFGIRILETILETYDASYSDISIIIREKRSNPNLVVTGVSY